MVTMREPMRDSQGRPVGERLADGSVVRFRQPVEPTSIEWAPRWLELFARDRARTRQALTNKARRATIKARAAERRRNDEAGLATVHWLPRNSDGVQHGDEFLPRPRSQR